MEHFHALARAREAVAARRPLSIGLLGNAADVLPECVRRGVRPDLVTDQTSAHDPLNGYVPNGMSYDAALGLRHSDAPRYMAEARRSMGEHVRAMLDRVHDTPAWEQRGRPLDVALWPEPVLDPLVEPERVVEQAHEHLDRGATILNYRFPSRSVAHHLEQMEALTELVDPAW